MYLLKPARLQDLTRGLINTGVPVAGVDDLRAGLAVESGGTVALEIPAKKSFLNIKFYKLQFCKDNVLSEYLCL